MRFNTIIAACIAVVFAGVSVLYGQSWTTQTGKGVYLNQNRYRASIGLTGSAPLDSAKLYLRSDSSNATWPIFKCVYGGTGATKGTRFIILGNGAVGIGTTNPGTYKLAVEGKIGAREVVVTTNAWADHVLKQEYKLDKLEDIEAYIKKNGTLPGIQSEKEAKTNGVAVGELQVKLLTKIEKLTLHLIAQDKRIKELEKTNEMLLKKGDWKK